MRSDYPLDRIIFIPAGTPPHKENGDLTTAQLRMRMVEMAIEDYPDFEVSDWEIHQKDASYTIDTVQYFLKSRDSQDEDFYLIVGADCLLELNTWKSPEWILDRIHTLVVGRPSYLVENADNRFLEKVTFISTPLVEISSTEIRKRIREGKSIRAWVPDKVEDFIRRKELYL